MPVGGVCTIRLGGGESVDAEVVGLRGQHVQMMPIGDTAGIRLGCVVEPRRTEAIVRASESMLGRIFESCGNPIDGKGEVHGGIPCPLYRPGSNPVQRRRIQDILPLGVRVLDGLISCGTGQRLAIMAGSGVGKSCLIGMIARHTKADVNVIALVGERGREVREFIENDLGSEGLARSVVIVATSDAPPLIRMRAAFLATAIAEFFRDRGRSVLLLMDSLTRFAMAAREVGLAIGEPPTVKGYTPSVFSILPKLLERVGMSDGSGSITGLFTILTEGDDIQDPIADAVRSIVDGHIVLSRKLAAKNHYPAVDVLHSLSRLHREVADETHLRAADQFRTLWSSYAEMEDFINMGIYAQGKNKTVDDAMIRHEAMVQFLKQGIAEGTTLDDTVTRLAAVVGQA